MKYYILFVILLPFGLSAQSLDNWVIGSGGESSGNSEIQLSWTLGEPNIATIGKDGLMFTEGFHQTYLEVRELILLQPALVKPKVNAYPNPTSDQVQVNFEDKLPRDFNLMVLDAKGKLLQFQKYQHTTEVLINLAGLPAAVYLISIQLKDQLPSLPHSLQIIKH